jgi:predicted Zn-dependent protease
MGRQVADEVNRRTTPVGSSEVQDYVARLGAKIADRFEFAESGPKFTFEVIATEEDNSLHEPLVLPGGYIFVPSRLLLFATDEAEFAGMLAQAIAREPFSLRIQNNATGIPVFSLTGSFMSDTSLPARGAIRESREMELQADKSAVLAVSRAGFDPAALLRFIERLQPPDSPRSPFPPRDGRITALRDALRDIPPAAYTESEEFYRVQQRLRPAATEPRSPPSLFTK